MKTKEKRMSGFATMTKKKRIEIASMGGKAAWKKGVANKFTSKTGKAAGKKGAKLRKHK